MAASKGYFARANYRFFSTDPHAPPHSDAPLELDESDIWNATSSPLTSKLSKKLPSACRTDRNISVGGGGGGRNEWNIGVGGGGGGRNERKGGGGGGGGVAVSLPVNVPDWSKILKEEYRENRRRDSDDDEDDDVADDDRIPPHEYVARQMARTRIASFSVHEGVGRTLKGRDLSRVRNAIWEKTGFQD